MSKKSYVDMERPWGLVKELEVDGHHLRILRTHCWTDDRYKWEYAFSAPYPIGLYKEGFSCLEAAEAWGTQAIQSLLERRRENAIRLGLVSEVGHV